jgi:hypothetical protein
LDTEPTAPVTLLQSAGFESPVLVIERTTVLGGVTVSGSEPHGLLTGPALFASPE